MRTKKENKTPKIPPVEDGRVKDSKWSMQWSKNSTLSCSYRTVSSFTLQIKKICIKNRAKTTLSATGVSGIASDAERTSPTLLE